MNCILFLRGGLSTEIRSVVLGVDLWVPEILVISVFWHLFLLVLLLWPVLILIFGVWSHDSPEFVDVTLAPFESFHRIILKSVEILVR